MANGGRPEMRVVEGAICRGDLVDSMTLCSVFDPGPDESSDPDEFPEEAPPSSDAGE